LHEQAFQSSGPLDLEGAPEGTCIQLSLPLADGIIGTALFQFR
jgi:hypothetical protein